MDIGNIADVNVGVVLNRKQAKYKSKNATQYELFNLKIYEDRQNGVRIDYDKFISEENLDSYTVKKNDLLLRLAFPLKVIIVDDELDGKLISNQYVSIRIDESKYIPVFVKWYLESQDAEHQLEKYIVGTAIRTIPIVKVRKIRLPNISIDKQKELSKLLEIWETQKGLYINLIKDKEAYYNSIIELIIKKERKNKNERKTITR